MERGVRRQPVRGGGHRGNGAAAPSRHQRNPGARSARGLPLRWRRVRVQFSAWGCLLGTLALAALIVRRHLEGGGVPPEAYVAEAALVMTGLSALPDAWALRRTRR